MKLLFVDTAGWVAAADAADPHGNAMRQARDHWLKQEGGLLTTDYVCCETLTVLRFRLGLNVAEAWWKQIETSVRLRIEHIDSIRADKARAIFFRYADKELSFTDCTSFVVMRELRAVKALTLDRHFQQMGFEVIPKITG